LGRFFYRSARTLRHTGSSIVRFMCTGRCTCITAAGIMAIGMPGSGTRFAGINGGESNVLLSKDLMIHRQFLQSLAVVSTALFCSTNLGAQVLKPGHNVLLRCLGNIPGWRYLDGRTADGTVGLASHLSPNFTGTKWRIVRAGPGVVALKCLGDIQGPRWLDGRTADGTVGLAPNRNEPFTGTRWQVLQVGYNNTNIVILKCLGDIEGPRLLDGRTANATVGLAPTTEGPFTGTGWEVVPID
jgi:hypothetical protein